MEYVELQGQSVPKIGLGTWNMRGKTCYQATLNALSLGYRHIDTAEMYRNESEVGRAINDSGVDRSEIFLVTKVSASHLAHDGVLQAAASSLERLRMSTIDLYLVHWPNDRIPIGETMAGMNELVTRGKVRRIGVSNFSVRQLQEAESASAARIFTNQIEYFIGHPQDAMLRYCQENDVLLTAYSPLDRGHLRQSQALETVAESHDVTVAQVALRWLIQQERVVAIPKSANPDRQRENLDVFSFELSEEQMTQLSTAYR
ncbi:MAG: aldo/keto reductase [Anaerolineales bacterium]